MSSVEVLPLYVTVILIVRVVPLYVTAMSSDGVHYATATLCIKIILTVRQLIFLAVK